MKPLIKTEYVNLALTIPAPWREFFDEHAARLGISRSAAICLAMKLGGPILEKFVVVMKEELHLQYERFGKSGKTAEILGPPDFIPSNVKITVNERRKCSTNGH